MTAILEPVLAPETVAPETVAPEMPAPPAAVAEPATVTTAPAARRVRRPRTFRVAPTYRWVGGLMLAAFVAVVQVAPAPNGPEPVPAAWEVLLLQLTLVALGAAVWGLARVRTWGPLAGVVAGGLVVAGVALCPLTGHHLIGGWWYAQLGLSGVMLAAPAALLLARQRGRQR